MPLATSLATEARSAMWVTTSGATVLELLEQSPTAGTMPTMWPWRGWIEQASGDDAALAAVDVAKVRRLPAARMRAAPRPVLLRTLFNVPSQYELTFQACLPEWSSRYRDGKHSFSHMRATMQNLDKHFRG